MNSLEIQAAVADALRGRGEGRSYRKRGGKHEHRFVAETSLGRALLPGEIVFHRDRNRANNEPDNLQLFASRSEFGRYIFALIRKG